MKAAFHKLIANREFVCEQQRMFPIILITRIVALPMLIKIRLTSLFKCKQKGENQGLIKHRFTLITFCWNHSIWVDRYFIHRDSLLLENGMLVGITFDEIFCTKFLLTFLFATCWVLDLREKLGAFPATSWAGERRVSLLNSIPAMYLGR